MIILSTLSLLISNAVSLRRDMSILYNRIAIIALLYAILQSLISCFSIISNGGIGIHGIGLHVTNITQVFLVFNLILLFLNSICIVRSRDISMFTPAGAPLIFGLFFWIIETTIKFSIKNKDFFVVKNYCFIELDKSKLCLVLYMLIYITIVFLPIFYLNSSFSFMFYFFYLNKIQWWALFLSIFLVFIGFLLNGVNFMFNIIYEYINTLINIIIIFALIFMNLYLIFDINLSEVIYSLLYFKYFRYILFITINLYLIYTSNIKGLFNVLLIFSIGYIIYNFCFFIGALYFIHFFYFFPVNSLAIPESLSLSSSEARSEDINNYNLLDDLLDKAVNIMLENKLYSSTEYINSPFVCIFVSIFSTLFGIANKTAIYIPSAFQCYTLPNIIDVKFGLINKSPILLEVIKANFKIVGGASIGGGESSLSIFPHEPLFQDFPENSIGDCLIAQNSDKIPSAIREEFIKDSKLCNIIMNNDLKYSLDFLLSNFKDKSSNLVCFQKDIFNKSKYYIFDYKDIHYNDREKISVYHKIGDYPDRSSMCDAANAYIYSITANVASSSLTEIDTNIHWLGGLESGKEYNKYSAYIFIKHDWIFSIENIKKKCDGNIFIGYKYETRDSLTWKNEYDPSNSKFCERVIGIYDHSADQINKHRKYYKLPFNSPAKQNFKSDIVLSDMENTTLNKEIYFYYNELI